MARGRSRSAQGVVKADPEAMQAVRTSMVPVRIGSRTYSAVHDPKCVVCVHPARVQIEERILFNESYKTIADWVSGHDVERIDGLVVVWPDLSAADLARHFRSNHCPIDAKILHELQEQRSGQLDYEALSGRVVDHVTFAQQVHARVQERMVRGEVEPSIREGIAAARLVAQIEQASDLAQQEDRTWFYEAAFKIYFDAAKRIMTPEQWSDFSDALSQDVTLRELTERAQNPEVIDAVVVGDAIS